MQGVMLPLDMAVLGASPGEVPRQRVAGFCLRDPDGEAFGLVSSTASWEDGLGAQRRQFIREQNWKTNKQKPRSWGSGKWRNRMHPPWNQCCGWRDPAWASPGDPWWGSQGKESTLNVRQAQRVQSHLTNDNARGERTCGQSNMVGVLTYCIKGNLTPRGTMGPVGRRDLGVLMTRLNGRPGPGPNKWGLSRIGSYQTARGSLMMGLSSFSKGGRSHRMG